MFALVALGAFVLGFVVCWFVVSAILSPALRELEAWEDGRKHIGDVKRRAAESDVAFAGRVHTVAGLAAEIQKHR